MSQFFANGLIAASSILLVAVSFQMIYRVVRFFHFAHAAVVTCGAFSAFALTRYGLPLAASVVLSIIMCALLGCGMHAVVYRPLQRRGGSSNARDGHECHASRCRGGDHRRDRQHIGRGSESPDASLTAHPDLVPSTMMLPPSMVRLYRR